MSCPSSNVSNVSNVKIMYIYTKKMKNRNYFRFSRARVNFPKKNVTALPYPQTRMVDVFYR